MKIGNADILASIILLAFMLSNVPVIVGAQEDRFMVDAVGIVTDNQTGFQWMAGPDEDMDWPTAAHVSLPARKIGLLCMLCL